jgi:hypothetical protein
LGLIKPAKSIKPYNVKYASSNFNFDSVFEKSDLTNLFVSSFGGIVLLNNDYFYVNTNATCPGKYIVGLVRQDEEFFVPPKLGLAQPLRISGTWIFENLYIDGQGFILQSGAKLIFRNCYLTTSSNVSFDFIQAQNGYIRFYDTKLLMQPVGGAIIRCVVGSDVIIVNSSLNGVSIEKATGTIIIKNSSVRFERNYTTLNNYNIIAENSFINRSGPANTDYPGTVKFNCKNCEMSESTTYLSGYFGDSSFYNCKFYRINIYQSNGTIQFYNCYFDFPYSGSDKPIVVYGGAPILRFYNCTIRTDSYYIANFNNSNSTTIFVNCIFRSSLGRFQKTGTGTNAIRTIGCVGNKDITTDSGFNAGEINDTNFVFDGNF